VPAALLLLRQLHRREFFLRQEKRFQAKKSLALLVFVIAPGSPSCLSLCHENKNHPLDGAASKWAAHTISANDISGCLYSGSSIDNFGILFRNEIVALMVSPIYLLCPR
jgi:hypothetical protein